MGGTCPSYNSCYAHEMLWHIPYQWLLHIVVPCPTTWGQCGHGEQCSRCSALHCSRQPLIKAPARIPPMQLSCAVAFRSAELAGAVQSAELAMALEHTSCYRDNIPHLLPDLVGAPLFPWCIGPRGKGCHNIQKVVEIFYYCKDRVWHIASGKPEAFSPRKF